jgi:hypothetical protein
MSAAATLQSPRNKTDSAAKPRAATPPKYMMRRRGVYYFKRRIPSDVAHAFPQYRGQVWKSLGTDNFEQAKLQLAVEVTQFDVTVSDARAPCKSCSRCPSQVPDHCRHDEVPSAGAYPAAARQVPVRADGELRWTAKALPCRDPCRVPRGIGRRPDDVP